MTSNKLVLIFCALSGLLTSPAIGQTVTVQSGEHATFSRLVFPDNPGRAWTTVDRGRTVEITFSEGVPELSLENVFDLIPKKRLSDISFEESVLTLSLDCECPVRLAQIPSGHIVIDIEDAPRSVTPPIQVSPTLILPRRISQAKIVLPVLAALLKEPDRVLEARQTQATAFMATPNQIRRHPMGRVPLVPVEDERSSVIQADSCELEELARDIFEHDPREAYQELVYSRRNLLTGEDIIDPKAVEKLAITYLRAGWGSEASAMVSMILEDRSDILVIGRALDGIPVVPPSETDPGCGPGTAIIALLSNVSAKAWRRADEREVVRLLDQFADQRWNDLGDRLRRTLTELNREELLIGLRSLPMKDQASEGMEVVAAGTDTNAIAASIELLEVKNSAGIAAEILHVENARALRPSIPAGETRDRLDLALLEALIIAGKPRLVIEMLEDEQATPDVIIDLVQRHLAPEERVEFIVRLEPLLSPGDPARPRARDELLSLGLMASARRFTDLPEDGPPIEESDPLILQEPWIARDFATLASAEPEERTSRNLLAEAIVIRNEAVLPTTDLAIAERALSRSEQMGVLIRSLLNEP